MKLKNKKTGEIGYFCFANWNDPVLIIMDKNGVQLAKYNSLAKLNEEWEDAPEEPGEYWFVGDHQGTYTTVDNNSQISRQRKEIGNYFETREEAEQAVEKLKAWKRLKDKGFRFERWQFLDNRCGICVQGNLVPDIVDELDILFGGEE